VGVSILSENELNIFTVEAVSRALGITPRTLRYYEQVGLISPTTRTSGGHRLYNQATVELLREILRLKDNLGISLQEIQEIIAAEESLKELRRTFHEDSQSSETQKSVVERYVCVLRDLIDKMNIKIENVKAMRNMYLESMERSLRFLDEMEKTEQGEQERQ
jgi:MerR family transcriptional regulator, repressor of the yfmOP operon